MSQLNEADVDNAEDNASGSDDDSDDDGIKVTIDKDKIEAAKSSYQNMQVCFITYLLALLTWYIQTFFVSAEKEQCYWSRICSFS